VSRATIMAPAPIIRPFRAEDGADFIFLVRALADAGGVDGPDDAGASRLIAAALADPPPIEVRLAEVDGHLVGYVVFVLSFSTFLARPVVVMEDMYVVGDARGNGVGVALFDAVVTEAVARGCCRVDWAAPKRLPGAVAFYRARGAHTRDDWHLFRLDGDELGRYQ
jgi:GNAT superfamily N-acetyltransferase